MRQASLEYLEDRTLLSLAGNQLFPSDNPWNQSIAAAPIAANSTAIINNIISLSGQNGRLHPDFGQVTGGSDPLYGIPYNIVHGNSTAKVNVVIDDYADESNIQPIPIPANAVVEGDTQDGPTVGQENRGDSHLIVYDEDNNIAYELFAASRPSENADGMWHAAQESVWNLNQDSFRPPGWTSADAAGLPILPGLVRPDEGLPVSEGGQGAIDHAIRFTLTNRAILGQYLYPASHTANPGNNNAAVQPAMGTRFRLKASMDISKLSPESQVIAQAMKTYGLILADNGSNFFFSGASESVQPDGTVLTWNDDDIQSTLTGLKSLHFSDFEVVDTTPIVTGLSTSTAAAGSTVTIVGQNFSGAAGHLQVFFGSIVAANVNVVDDSHVTVSVPDGAGTVDVRVQSGVTLGADSRNAKSPIFGYGTSSTSAADRFTYSGSQQSTASAAFVGTDSTTGGTWTSAYGSDGYQVIGGATKLPAYASVTPINQLSYTWASSSTDGRALLASPTSPSRVAASWYNNPSFSVDLNLTDGQSHRINLYMVDWDTAARSQRVEVLDPTNETVLDTRTVSSFHGGQYLTWTLTGHVQFRFTTLAGSNAVLGGIFFGPSPATVVPPAVVDSSFESVAVGSGTFNSFLYDPTGSSWTFAGSSGISGNGSGFTSANPNAPAGSQVAFLQNQGTISQTIANWAAGTYTLSLLAAQRGNNNTTSQSFQVLVDGQAVATISPGSTAYQAYTTTRFTVAAGPHTISFQGLNAGGDCTAFLDSVAVAVATSTTSSGAVVDSSFESVAVGSGTFNSFLYDPTGSSWTFAGSSGISGNGSGFTSANPNAPAGSQVAFLQNQGTISQTIANWAAGTYTLSLLAAQRSGNQWVQSFQVLVDNVVVASYTPSSTSYQSFTTGGFTVTGGSHTITFQGTGPAGGDNTALLDNITLATV